MKTLKLFTFICGFLSFVSLNTYSQTDFTLEQLTKYNKQKLSLELPPKRGVFSLIIGMPAQGWKGYQGIELVSESEFYKIAGYDDLAIKIEKRKTVGKILTWTGFAAVIGGFVITMTELDSHASLGGISLVLVGSGISAWGMQLDAKNLKPYDVASGIAGEYNLQLSISIKKQF